jgi:hypothetical protein
VLSSFKDFVDTATTASCTGAAAFRAFLVMAIFVLCLMAFMWLDEEYKSLFSCTEEDKVNCPLLNQFSIPTVVASVMSLVTVALAFVEGKDLMGTLYFNGAFMIPFLYGITHHIIQRREAISASRFGYLFNKQLATRFVGCSIIMCSWTSDSSRYIMASKLNGTIFSARACTAY